MLGKYQRHFRHSFRLKCAPLNRNNVMFNLEKPITLYCSDGNNIVNNRLQLCVLQFIEYTNALYWRLLFSQGDHTRFSLFIYLFVPYICLYGNYSNFIVLANKHTLTHTCKLIACIYGDFTDQCSYNVSCRCIMLQKYCIY